MSENLIHIILGADVVAGLPDNEISALGCELAAEILRDPELTSRLRTTIGEDIHQGVQPPV